MAGDLAGLLLPETQQRLTAAQAGQDTANHVTIAGLTPGQFGVLDARVVMIQPAKPFTSKSGRQGLLQRITLGDSTGEIVLVLWDEELRHVREGTFTPGVQVRLRGATVSPGWRGGCELGLGAAIVERMSTPASAQSPTELVGHLEGLGPTQVVGLPPNVQFRCDATVLTSVGKVHVVLWDGCVRVARSVLPGAKVRITQVQANPVLDGWWTTGPQSRLSVV